MVDISKLMSIDIGNYSEVLQTSLTNIASIMGLDVPAGGPLGRGVWGGGTGLSSVKTDIIQYVQIDTLSDAADFGDLNSGAITGMGACSNGQTGRLLFGGGNTTAVTTVMQFVTVATLSNSGAFGNLTVARFTEAGSSNRENDRAVFGGGYTSAGVNIIDYATISSIGDATDFGDLTTSRYALGAATNGSNERCVFIGGKITSSTFTDVMDYITVNSTSNAASFGTMTVATGDADSTSNFTNERGVAGGGILSGATRTNKIEYITINSLGDGTDFGDLLVEKNAVGALSNGESERGLFGGGANQSSVPQDEIEYITINSLGNAAAFGLLLGSLYNMRGDSDA